jgi:3-phenylpropionate/trans-cinnamate dioxygenase ferredoxin reductase subunit
MKLRTSYALKEGGERDFAISTTAFTGDGRVEAIHWVKNTGRPPFEAIPGTEETHPADLVLLAMGFLSPEGPLLEALGVEKDARGNARAGAYATSADGVFAAGDVANAQHPLLGVRLRVEHWHNALEQGPAAARSMLGAGEPYDRIPYFFSDQYEVGMEYAGHATEWDEVVFRGDVEAREFIAFWVKDGRVLAGMNVNIWDVTDDIQALIRSRAAVDPARLRDPDVELASLGSS